MKAKGPIRLGVAGLGRAGWNNFTREMESQQKHFRVVAACDIVPARRRKAAERFGCATYERVEDLVADPNVELVFVATRNIDHFRHAAMALKAGKHVHLEKPMTVDYAQARRLAALARRSKGLLLMRHNARYWSIFQRIRQIISSGVLGDVFEIKMRRTRYIRRDDWQTTLAAGGGLMRNTGSHMIDQGLQLLDAPVKDIWCQLRRVAAVGDAEDHVRLMIVGTNGRIIDIEHSGGAEQTDPEWTVLGTRGHLVTHGTQVGKNLSITLRYLDPRRPLKPRSLLQGPPGRQYGTEEDLPWIQKTIDPDQGRKGRRHGIWDDIHAAIRLGRTYPIAVEQAVEAMRVLTVARRQTEFRDK